MVVKLFLQSTWSMIEQDLALGEYLDLYSNYEKILILGDFNVSVKEIIWSTFVTAIASKISLKKIHML